MEEELLKLAIQQGIWAVLFIILLLYILKEQKKRDTKAEIREIKGNERETKYQEIIAKLTEKFECIEYALGGIKDDVKEVKDKIFK